MVQVATGSHRQALGDPAHRHRHLRPQARRHRYLRRIILEARFTTVAAIQDMINRIGILNSQLAGHIIIVPVVVTIVNGGIKPPLTATS